MSELEFSNEELVLLFERLDDEINDLSNKLEKRNYSNDRTNTKKHKKPCIICTGIKRGHPNCCEPVVDIDSLSGEFPVDVQRLQNNNQLKDAFHKQQFQTSDQQNPDIEMLVEIYSMPAAVIALPDESWNSALRHITLSKDKQHLDTLVTNWKNRKTSHTGESKLELSRKLKRHDESNFIMQKLRADK